MRNAPGEVERTKQEIEDIKKDLKKSEGEMSRNMIGISAIFVSIFSFILIGAGGAVETPSQFCAECQYHESCDGCPVIGYLHFSRFDLPPPDCFFKLDLLGLREKVNNLSFYHDLVKRKEHEFKKGYSQL